MHTDTQSLLSLLYLSSPALPIGAFAYSQGLEKAIELDWVSDAATLEEWCDQVIQFGLCELDLPLIGLLRDAMVKSDQSLIEELNEEVFACRESFELFEEEKHLGGSLARLYRTQDLASRLQMNCPLPANPSFLCAYAACSLALGLDLQAARVGFLWSWLENQIAVACKTIPLGQSDAQSVLLSLKTKLSEYLDAISPVSKSSELSGSLPGQALSSALHEAQYSRLFRS